MIHSIRLSRFLLPAVLVLCFLGMSAVTVDVKAAQASVVKSPIEQRAQEELERKPIQFKQESTHASIDDLKPFVALGVISLFVVAVAFWIKKKKPMLLSRLGGSGSRIKVIETRRVTTRLTLYLIECDGNELLLSVSGDNVVQMCIATPQAKPLVHGLVSQECTQ